MSVFVDTSALLALVNPNDEHHARATVTFAGFEDDEPLVTTNNVVVETLALVKLRLGMATLATLRHDILGALETRWIDPSTHEAALDALEAHGRQVSFVDHTSVGFMSGAKIRTTIAFDDDFANAGIQVVPPVANGLGTEAS